MNPASTLISILLSIGGFLGFPYVPPPVHETITLPGLEKPISTSTISFPSYAPLLSDNPTTIAVGPVAKTPSPKKQKLPILVLNAPTFKPIAIPYAGASTPIPTSVTPSQNQQVQTPEASSTVAHPPVTTPTPLPAVVSPPPVATANTLDEKARAAVINIYCTKQVGSTVTIVTGSGIIIDPRGVILTNAHVADHILLQDYINDSNSGCVIRKGSPASPYYKAAMLYISPDWLRLHGSYINSFSQPQETGEGDYAIIAITGSVNSQTSLPQNFPYLPVDISTNSLDANTSILAVGYPAGSLSSSAVIRNLQIKTGPLTILANYTFGGSGADLIRTTATPIAESGSSGGGILNSSGQLIGLIATTISDNNSSSLDLQALSLSYINRDLRRATGLDIIGFLNRDLVSVAANFKQNTEPTLSSYFPH